jgi:sugar/nucleoside kinase (ribokinase family)
MTQETPPPRGRGGVLVVGDVINDILVRPLTAITVDSDTRSQIVRRPGGSAANLACWLGRQGNEVVFVGRVGASDHAFHTEFLNGFGVDAQLAIDTEAETGTIVIIVDEAGRRTMLTDRAANLNLVPADVPTALLDGASLLHFTGYSLFEPDVRTTMLELLERARVRGTPVSVDPSSVSLLNDVGVENFLSWTAGAELAFPNRDESAALTGTSDPMLAAVRLTEHYRIAVVTLDGDGAVVACRGDEPVLVPVDRVAALDSTGAGDSFCAGFLDHWTRTGDHIGAARAGGLLARDAVSRMGARPPAHDPKQPSAIS